MKQRKIGTDYVGEIGLGCMGMSHVYGPSNESENLKVLQRALELGCDFWDTADFYGAGKNEQLLRKVLEKHRSKVFLSSKVGNVYDRALTSHREQVEANAPWIVDGTPQYIRKCIDLSLQRLGVEEIDLYYLHRVDTLVPVEESVGAMAELVQQGKVRYLGLSEASANTIRRAAKVHPITALQSEYSLWTRDIEADILPVCRELGITLVAYSPLGRGLLTGAIKGMQDLTEEDWRRRFPRFQEGNIEKNLILVKSIDQMAERYAASPAQVVLAWLLARGEDIIPIPGTRHVRYLEQNIQAAAVVLSTEEIQLLDGLQAAGRRCPEMLENLIDKS